MGEGDHTVGLGFLKGVIAEGRVEGRESPAGRRCLS